MSDKEMRLNLIKLFAIGVKYANAAIIDDDFFYRDIIEEIFDKENGEPASVEEIFDKLNVFESVDQIEERKKLKGYVAKIKNNNNTIELIRTRIDDLNII